MVYMRASAIWLMLMIAETIHGIARTIFLLPLIGDFRARQVAVFTGSLIIFGITLLFIRWIRASGIRQLLCIGLMWLVLTLAFEMVLGKLVFDMSWERLLADYKIFEGGMLPLGLVVVMLSPLLAAKIRRTQKGEGI